MAKDGNAYSKRERERKKKGKAAAKLERRSQRKLAAESGPQQIYVQADELTEPTTDARVGDDES